jgi:hypothetical protein
MLLGTVFVTRDTVVGAASIETLLSVNSCKLCMLHISAFCLLIFNWLDLANYLVAELEWRMFG